MWKILKLRGTHTPLPPSQIMLRSLGRTVTYCLKYSCDIERTKTLYSRGNLKVFLLQYILISMCWCKVCTRTWNYELYMYIYIYITKNVPWTPQVAPGVVYWVSFLQWPPPRCPSPKHHQYLLQRCASKALESNIKCFGIYTFLQCFNPPTAKRTYTSRKIYYFWRCENVSKSVPIGLRFTGYLANTLKNILCFWRMVITMRTFHQQLVKQLIVAKSAAVVKEAKH